MRNRAESADEQSNQVIPTPMSGWLSNGRTDPFDAFSILSEFCVDTLQPLTSVQRQRASNPEVLALRTLIANLQVVEECSVTSWMTLMNALTECAGCNRAFLCQRNC